MVKKRQVPLLPLHIFRALDFVDRDRLVKMCSKAVVCLKNIDL